jgi:hypothetical protein
MVGYHTDQVLSFFEAGFQSFLKLNYLPFSNWVVFCLFVLVCIFVVVVVFLVALGFELLYHLNAPSPFLL